MNALNEKIWLNTEEAAQYLSTTRKGILNRVHRGDLPVYKIGRTNRYKRIELDRIIEQSRNNSESTSQVRKEGN
jgi:excisionase family DNA binding protein